LFEFFICFFSFSLFSELVTCLCCQCTHQGGDWGPERPRTGAWSLLAVMSDWQCGVGWLLAEYCRCKLRLDFVAASEERARKFYALRGLRGVERQIGPTRGTRRLAGSSAGCMVARKARGSRRSETVQGSGSQPKSARGVCCSSPQNQPGYLVKPQNQDLQRHIPEVPLVGVYLSLSFRVILVFQLSPYKLRGERMGTISRNPCLFALTIFPSYFP
jgi:hypothetical protein